jgi:hypothetical protein
MTETPTNYRVPNNVKYSGATGFKTIENFPHCGNDQVHIYVIFALKYLLRLGKKDDIRTELKKAIDYLARAYYIVDPSTFKPEDLTDTFKDY